MTHATSPLSRASLANAATCVAASGLLQLALGPQTEESGSYTVFGRLLVWRLEVIRDQI